MDVSKSGDPFAPDIPEAQEAAVFPATRFTEAGATPEEVEAFQARFDALSPELQDAQLAVLASIATADIAAMIERERISEQEAKEAAGKGEPEADAAEPEPAVAEPEPEQDEQDEPTPEQAAREDELRAQIAADEAELAAGSEFKGVANL